MDRRLMLLVPALIMAAGLIGGTALSAALDDDGGLEVLAGPALVAATMLVGCVVARRHGQLVRGGMLAGTLLAGSVLVAAAILAAKDPARVTDMLPILGGGAVLPLIAGAGSGSGSGSGNGSRT